jgi:hypothetical protein
MGIFSIFCCCSKKEDSVKKDEKVNESFDPVEAPEAQENPDASEEKQLPMKTVINPLTITDTTKIDLGEEQPLPAMH